VGGFACTEVGCSANADASVTVLLQGLVTKNAATAPLALEACADGGSCVTATLTKSGTGFDCKITSGEQSGTCFVETNGDVTLLEVLDATTGAKSTVTVTATVTDSANAKVLDGSSSVTITTSTPNGPDCDPVCHQASVTFKS
jgi:hypothetical protein